MTLLPKLAIAWAINAAALWAADALWGSVRIHGWAAYLIGSAVLGIANTIIKPVVAGLTLPLIVVTLGFFYLVINIAMVALAEWIAPPADDLRASSGAKRRAVRARSGAGPAC